MNRCRTLASLGVLLTIAACGGGEGQIPAGPTVKDYITGVRATIQASAIVASPAAVASATAIAASFHPGRPPSGTQGPVATAEEQSTALVGQPLRYGVMGSSTFSTVYLSVNGTDGYWQVDLPLPDSAVALVLQLAPSPPSRTFGLETTLGTASGPGPALADSIAAGDLSTADVVVTLTWQGPSDVDLHVVDPNGFEVFYASRTSPQGGHLDLDSNAACEIDGVNQETISWPQGRAPYGEYLVWAQYYADCAQPSAAWKIEVSSRGSINALISAASFSHGSFEGESDDSQKAQEWGFHFTAQGLY